MKRVVLAVVALLALPVLALAQTSCPDCVIGIFDDTAMNTNYGTTTNFVPKDIYLGVHLGAGGPTGVTGLEFSISGLSNADGVLVTSTDGITEIPPNVLLGNVPAPADTSTGNGGMNVAWPSCQVGSAALVKISLLPLSPSPNKVLRVLHKFPASNPNFGFSPVMIGCDAPLFSAFKVTGGCYVLNWDGTSVVGACDHFVPVVPTSWSAVKRLYD